MRSYRWPSPRARATGVRALVPRLVAVTGIAAAVLILVPVAISATSSADGSTDLPYVLPVTNLPSARLAICGGERSVYARRSQYHCPAGAKQPADACRTDECGL